MATESSYTNNYETSHGAAAALHKLLDVYNFDIESMGYRHINNGNWSTDNINNALFAFSTWCAFKNRKEIERSGIYKFDGIPDDFDVDDEDGDLIILSFERKNLPDFIPEKLDAFSRCVDEHDKIQFLDIIRNQTTLMEARYAPYVCAESQIYKIHLNPRIEYLSYYLGRIMRLRDTHGDIMNSKVCALKVITDYGNAYNKKFPVIVIYPRGAEAAMAVITLLQTEIEYKPDSSISITPRYNYGIEGTHGVLFIANGDGDTKRTIIESNDENLIQKIFEITPEFPYSFFKGSEILPSMISPI